MGRFICTLRVIWTQEQRQKVNKMTKELKDFQANIEVHKENFVYIVNHIIKFYEKCSRLSFGG